MDITELGAIGELVGGVAVLVTFVYLAVQVKDNTHAERAETYRSLVQDVNRSFLDSTVTIRCSLGHSMSLMSMGQQAHSLQLSGNIDPEFAVALENMVASFAQVPGVAEWWSSMEALFVPSFTSSLRKRLNSEDCPPPFTEFMPWFSEAGPAEQGQE